jgi:hypothetical protein
MPGHMTTQTRPVPIRAGAALIDGDLTIPQRADDFVIELNREAIRRMRAHVELEIVAGATHLLKGPGTLEQVSRLAVAWCQGYLSKARP